MNKGFFLSNKSPVSERWAIFEDDEVSAWLYLTNPNENIPIADLWIYNRIPTPISTEIKKFRNGPPPASTEYAGPNAFVSSSDEATINFKWSKDGNAVALIINGTPIGYIVAGVRNGFNKNLLKSGPWGNTFEEEKYKIVFG